MDEYTMHLYRHSHCKTIMHRARLWRRFETLQTELHVMAVQAPLVDASPWHDPLLDLVSIPSHSAAQMT